MRAFAYRNMNCNLIIIFILIFFLQISFFQIEFISLHASDNTTTSVIEDSIVGDKLEQVQNRSNVSGNNFSKSGIIE
jgi:predicted RND superfamily exporter protein